MHQQYTNTRATASGHYWPAYSKEQHQESATLGSEPFPRLLSIFKPIKITIYINIIFPLVFQWCETWSLTLQEKHRLRVSENVVGRYVDQRRKMEQRSGEDFIRILLQRSK